jgi:exodeoxyribonuclease-3
MKLATWNVNSVRARLDALIGWLGDTKPDVVCLQEIKCTDEAFPRETFESLGYNCAVHGQRTYHGVAILSRRPLEDVAAGLPGGAGDGQARYLEAVIGGAHGIVRVATLYAPNGNPIGSENFAYKLAWLERLRNHAKSLLANEEPLALMGDYNVIPRDSDCHDPAAWANDALFQPQSRAALRRLENLGLSDAVRERHPEPGQYTFWDYQAGSWRLNHGIRIDHVLLSPQAADRLKDCAIDKHMREGEKPSDHVPVWVELDI